MPARGAHRRGERHIGALELAAIRGVGRRRQPFWGHPVRTLPVMIAAAALALPSAAAGQQAHAAPVQGPAPVIDGRLDDAAWGSAQPISEFVQKNPDEGQPASERTEVRFLYTDHDLYV